MTSSEGLIMTLERDHRMTVFAGSLVATRTCRPVQLFGRRFLATLSDAVPVDAAVEIDCGDSLVYAEVCACWQHDGAVHAVLQLMQVLTGHGLIMARVGLA